ncbi:hypothetical protein EPN44_05820 [bacterium]|nr:MAG: hypothetical protein EPN44_05820 [bacterium]
MRELAAVAAARGLSLGSVAEAYGKRAKASVNGRNVAEHFRARRPQKATIQTYCSVLGVGDEHRRLVEGEGLTSAQVAVWSSEVRQHLAAMNAMFEGDVLQAVDEAWQKVGAVAARCSVEAYALASYRLRSGLVSRGTDSFDPALDAFAAELMPTLNLRAMLRAERPDDDGLWGIWSAALVTLWTVEAADVVTSVARELMRAKGLDVHSLDDRLERERRAFEQRLRTMQETPYLTALRQLLFFDKKHDPRDSVNARKVRGRGP